MGERVLCTFPGKFGDLLWALPTVRAISRRVGAPVDLLIPDQFRGIVPLLQEQPYLGTVWHDGAWAVQDTAPISPRIPPFIDTLRGRWDHIVHLGYRDWPTPDVVQHTRETANTYVRGGLFLPLGDLEILPWELDLSTPWIAWPITVPEPTEPLIAIAFTDEHFELKLGVGTLVLEQFARRAPDFHYRFLYTAGSRWDRECWRLGLATPQAWTGYAQVIADCDVLLTDCSAAHVLAVAMGKPAVLMEPNLHRHNDVFYPLGKKGPQVTLVTGTDGQPTFDARHVYDALQPFLGASPRA